jgi:hypothetical protein
MGGLSSTHGRNLKSIQTLHLKTEMKMSLEKPNVDNRIILKLTSKKQNLRL